ncbi:hypothetical protein DFJ74DRAFT_670426 [Hyaloraphidium curvatum]|nr:hypothetical protein DFJ74DRAFT_670426 [Hyaloraphidium curvatum]
MAGNLVHTILWAVFAIMSGSTGFFYFLAVPKPSTERNFHYITGAITMIAAIAYYSMAGDFGVVKVDGRPFYYARYIDWALTTPLLLLDLLVLAGADTTRIVFIIFLDVVMVVTGLFGGLVTDSLKWGYFAMGCIAFVGLLIELLGPVRAAAARASAETGALFDQLAYWTLGLWTAYPIVWGLAEGSNFLSLEDEVGLYAVLDVSAKALFGFWLLLRHQGAKGIELGESA